MRPSALAAAAAAAAALARWPTFEQFQSRLEAWAKNHPELFKLESPGRSVQGRPVYAAILTDTAVPADDKEHVLLTTLHSGIERGGTTSALRVIEWLLSGEALARETLRRQVIVAMPMVNPDGYVEPAFVNAHGLDAYLNWTLQGPESPEKNPEAVAVQAMMDRFQPEVHTDLHGNDLSFSGYIHFEGHVNNQALRSFEPEVERLMDEAALAEGFPSHRGEADEQRLTAWAEPGLRADKLSRKKPRVFAGTYCYNRYHTLLLASENAWERSCLARHRRLFAIGNEVWPGELHRGYPVRTIVTHSHQIVAQGRTAAERRRSRVELWNKQELLTAGFVNPQREGALVFACATSPAAAASLRQDDSLAGLRALARSRFSSDPVGVLEPLHGWPDGPGQWGPHAKVTLSRSDVSAAATAGRIEHGLALRLRIPYAKSTLADVRLNGRPVPAAGADAYATWVARGYRFVQIELPPARRRDADLFLVTCRYALGEARPAGWLSR